MTSTATTPSAEPVLDEGKIAGRLTGAITAGVAIADLAGLHLQAGPITTGALAVLSAVCAAANAAVPWWRAHHARAHVTPVAAPKAADGSALLSAKVVAATTTPLADPTTADGEQLVALSTARAMAARAAADAAVSGQSTQLPIGSPAPTPLAEDTTIVGDAA